jgi:hypothetical protein
VLCYPPSWFNSVPREKTVRRLQVAYGEGLLYRPEAGSSGGDLPPPEEPLLPRA